MVINDITKKAEILNLRDVTMNTSNVGKFVQVFVIFFILFLLFHVKIRIRKLFFKSKMLWQMSHISQSHFERTIIIYVVLGILRVYAALMPMPERWGRGLVYRERVNWRHMKYARNTIVYDCPRKWMLHQPKRHLLQNRSYTPLTISSKWSFSTFTFFAKLFRKWF